MNFSAAPHLLAASCALLVLPTAGTTQEFPDEVVLQWSETQWTPAVPTSNKSWFLGVAPRTADLRAGSSISLKAGTHQLQAKVLHFDEAHRLCLIETPEPVSGIRPVEFADTPLPEAGRKLNCWKPDSSCPTTIVGKEYSIRGEPLSSPLLRVRVADAEEFCHPGTPLVCGEGKLFGILTEVISETSGEAHAIPASCLTKLLTEFERYQRSGKVRVGLVFEDRAKTPQVVEVRPQSPAASAGMKPGDVILSVAGHDVPDLDDLTQVMHLLTAGNPVDVRILRGLQEETVHITPEFADP